MAFSGLSPHSKSSSSTPQMYSRTVSSTPASRFGPSTSFKALWTALMLAGGCQNAALAAPLEGGELCCEPKQLSSLMMMGDEINCSDACRGVASHSTLVSAAAVIASANYQLFCKSNVLNQHWISVVVRCVSLRRARQAVGGEGRPHGV